MTGPAIPVRAWTGGKRPAPGFRRPDYLALRLALFREQWRTFRDAWGDMPDRDTLRTFARRARYDAWATLDLN